MNFTRYIVYSGKTKHKCEHMILLVMIGQSKINTFFKRQSATSIEYHTKTAGASTASECTRPSKRKRDETSLEVQLSYYLSYLRDRCF